MKKLRFTSILILLSFSILSWGGVCQNAYIRAERAYQKGEYENARQTFMWCQTHCKEAVDQKAVSNYISLCEKRIEQNRNAQIAARTKKQDQELQSRKQIEQNKFIYFSCDADLFGKAYPRLGRELSFALAKLGYKFTREKDQAYWIISITVIPDMDEELSKKREYDEYFVTVDALGNIYNTIQDVEYPFAQSLGGLSPNSYEQAVEIIYAQEELKKSIIEDILFIIQN